MSTCTSLRRPTASLSPWDDNLPKKFVEFEIRRRLRSIRRCIHVPSLSSIDELVPTTNFMSEPIRTFAEFVYSVGKSVMLKDESGSSNSLKETRKIREVRFQTREDLAALMSSDDEGIGSEAIIKAKFPILGKKSLLTQLTKDGFLADEEDNDDDDESSGFYSDGSEYAPSSDCRPRKFRPKTSSELCLHSQLPAWLKNNEFIVGGHRPPAYCYKRCLRSIFELHSETGNIWSHGLGAIACMIYAFYFFSSDVIPGLTIYDKLAFAVFFSSAISCMGMSAIYHTLACHSNRVCMVTCKLDFTGITLLIFGSFYPWLYYTFYDHPGLRFLYGLLSSATALATIKMNLSDEFAHAHYRGIRSAVYILYAMICGVFPVIHFCMIYGLQKMIYECHLLRFACMVAAYVFGALVYSLRLPEKYWPGSFDFGGQSHQIMHICVILGNLAQYWGCHGLAYRRHMILQQDSGSVYSTLEPFLLAAWNHLNDVFAGV